MLFPTRDLLVDWRTQTINALRGHRAECGVVAPQGPAHVDRLASALEDPDSCVPDAVRELGSLLFEQVAGFNAKIEGLKKDIHASAAGRGGATPDERAGDRPDHGDGDPGFRAADGGLSARPGLSRLARAGAAPALDRRQAAAGSDNEDRRLLRRCRGRCRRTAPALARDIALRRRRDARPDAPDRQQDLHVPGKDGRSGFRGVAGLPAAADGILGQAQARQDPDALRREYARVRRKRD